MSILSQLKEEHDNINKFIPTFYKMGINLVSREVRKEALDLSMEFILNYIENYHHGKEEELLFPLAASCGLLRGGGPRCTHFYGKFLNTNFNRRISAQVKNYPDIKEYKIRKSVSRLVEENSPLKIPLEEHEQGYYLVQMIKFEISKMNESTRENLFVLSKLIRWYAETLRNHVDKENDCLFVRLESVIHEDQWESLNPHLENFNYKHEETKLKGLESLNSLLYL